MFLKKLLSSDGKQDRQQTTPPQGMQTMGVSLQRKFAKGVNYNMKIVIKGDRTVGKTCLFLRLQGQKFKEEYIPTEKIQATSIQWNYKATDDIVKVDVWDVVDRGKKKKRTDGLKLDTTLDAALANPCLDAEFIDVYKGTHGVIFIFDITKQWTFDYVVRELPQVAVSIPVLILANHRDMGHHRTVTEDQVRYYAEEMNASRPPDAGRVRYAESSMRNGFGLKYIHKFFNLPFLQLQRESLLQQLNTNSREQQLTIEELEMDQESEDFTYDVFLNQLTTRRREQQEQLSNRAVVQQQQERKADEAGEEVRSPPPPNGRAVPVISPRQAPSAQKMSGLPPTPVNSPTGLTPITPTTPSTAIPPKTPQNPTSETKPPGFMSRLFNKGNKEVKAEVTPETSADMTTLTSRMTIEDVNDFVPDDQLDHSFLEDLRGDTRSMQDDVSLGEEDSDEDDGGGNPLVANFQDDIDSDDDDTPSPPISHPYTIPDDHKPLATSSHPYTTPDITTTTPEEPVCDEPRPATQPIVDESKHSADEADGALFAEPERVFRLETAKEDEEGNSDDVGVTVLQDEDISSAEDGEGETGIQCQNHQTTTTATAVTGVTKIADEPTTTPPIPQLCLEDLNLLEQGFDFTTGLPRAASMGSDMAASSGRADTDTDSSTHKKKKKRHDKDKESSQRKHRKHRDKEVGDGGEVKKKKKKRKDGDEKRELTELEAFLGPSIDTTRNTATYEQF